MKLDALLTASGLVGNVEVSPDAVDALRDMAYSFLLGGGNVSLTEYAQLSPDSRVALRAAGTRLVAESAALVAERLIAQLGDELASVGQQGADAAAQALASAASGAGS